jgi:hypothetical protein
LRTQLNGTEITDGSIQTIDLADGSVTDTKLADGSVTITKLALGANKIVSGSTPATSGTSIIATNTTPVSTNGTQLWTQTITPNNANSKFTIDQTLMVDTNTTNRNISIALFRNTTCVYAVGVNIATPGRPQILNVHAIDQPGSINSVVYSLRVGISSSGTWYVNQNYGSTITYGNTVNASNWSIKEFY